MENAVGFRTLLAAISPWQVTYVSPGSTHPSLLFPAPFVSELPQLQVLAFPLQ